MRRPIPRAATVVVLIVTFFMLPVAAGASNPNEQSVLAVRAQFGLTTDLNIVRSLAGTEVSPLAGIPLMNSEEREMERRRFVQENLAALKSYGLSVGKAFGGVFIDQRAGGEVVVSFVGDTDGHLAATQAAAPAGAKLRLRSVEFSHAYLMDLHSRVEGDVIEGAPVATHIVSVETSVVANAVRVGLATKDQSEIDAIRVRYGTAGLSLIFVGASVDPDGCVSRSNCGPPWRAGIAHNDACTSNFVARSGGVYHQLTSGHCFAVGTQITHNGAVVGNVTLEKYEDNSTADIGRASMNVADKSNLMYLTVGTQRPVTSREGHDADTEGDAVCQSGLITGFFCGTITSVNFLQHYAGSVDLPWQRKATYARAPGDSGAPVFYGNKAKGVHSGPASDGSGNAVYSHVWELEIKMGVTVYTG